MVERQLVIVSLLNKIQDAQFSLNFNVSMTQILQFGPLPLRFDFFSHFATLTLLFNIE